MRPVFTHMPMASDITTAAGVTNSYAWVDESGKFLTEAQIASLRAESLPQWREQGTAGA